jgi:hypothetical protein
MLFTGDLKMEELLQIIKDLEEINAKLNKLLKFIEKEEPIKIYPHIMRITDI